jgi:hypothetical protein
MNSLPEKVNMGRFLKKKRRNASVPLSTTFHRGKKSDQSVGNLQRAFPRFLLSKKGMAIPVTFLILFVSLSFVVSLTYYFAVSKINNRSQILLPLSLGAPVPLKPSPSMIVEANSGWNLRRKVCS